MLSLIHILTLLLFSAGTGISAAKTYDLKSPDGKIAVRVDVSADAVTYSISRDGKELIAPSPLSLTLADGRVLGRKASVRKASAKSVDEIIEAPFYKRSAVEDRYNSLTLTFKGDYGIDFRAYDDGAAYRFRTSMKDEITVTDELVAVSYTHLDVYKRQVLRPVERNPHQKIVPGKEVAPRLVNQRAVGLEDVLDLLAIGVFLLEVHRLPVEIHPQQQRFAAVPAELHRRNLVGLDILFHVKFQQLVAHHGLPAAVLHGLVPVSYTHLDVYKRQPNGGPRTCSRCAS